MEIKIALGTTAHNVAEHHIKIAADSVEHLRKPDVMRVLEHAGKDRKATAVYIIKHRADLAEEVREVMDEEFDIKL